MESTLHHATSSDQVTSGYLPNRLVDAAKELERSRILENEEELQSRAYSCVPITKNIEDRFDNSDNLLEFSLNRARRHFKENLEGFLETNQFNKMSFRLLNILVSPAVFSYYVITGNFTYKNPLSKPKKE